MTNTVLDIIVIVLSLLFLVAIPILFYLRGEENREWRELKKDIDDIVEKFKKMRDRNE
jgi:hypothetical protein